MRPDSVFITWERHRRTHELAAALGMPLLELISTRSGVARYAELIFRTTMHLARTRVSCVVVQCPSVVLSAWAALLRPVFGYALIVDLHNEAVEPFVNKSAPHRFLLRRIHRAADLGIVTNGPLAAIVESNGGRAVVLPDRIPTIGHAPSRPARENPSVVYVCTFAPDEPYDQVILAAARLSGRATVHITGRKPANAVLPPLPPNVRLTGFLPDVEYEQLLRDATVIVDLTAMENCLVCGAYEAVALGKPLVTSDTAALRAHFRRGTVFTRHDPESLAHAIDRALERRETLADEMQSLRPELEREWADRCSVLVAAAAALPDRDRSTRKSLLPSAPPRVDSCEDSAIQ